MLKSTKLYDRNEAVDFGVGLVEIDNEDITPIICDQQLRYLMISFIAHAYMHSIAVVYIYSLISVSSQFSHVRIFRALLFAIWNLFFSVAHGPSPGDRVWACQRLLTPQGTVANLH